MSRGAITQDALDRLERTARRELRAHERLDNTRLTEVNRRLDDLNNSHEKALEEKRRTDAAALQVQERMITRSTFEQFKESHAGELAALRTSQATQRALAEQSAKATARLWSLGMATVAIVVEVLIAYLTRK